jgi:hypothetical protein
LRTAPVACQRTRKIYTVIVKKRLTRHKNLQKIPKSPVDLVTY